MTTTAATVWQPARDPSEGEYGQSTAVDIIDPADSSTFLVDPSSVNIVDTGVTLTGPPQTIWSSNDGS